LIEDERVMLLVRGEEDKPALASQEKARAIIFEHNPAPVCRRSPKAYLPCFAAKDTIAPWHHVRPAVCI
jgi:hypothetical protein